jgi:hypothetical protein
MKTTFLFLFYEFAISKVVKRRSSFYSKKENRGEKFVDRATAVQKPEFIKMVLIA